MKHNNLIISLLALVTFAVACDKEQTTSQQIDKVQAETKQAAQDMKDYTYAQKSAFVETMQGQLAALNRDLDQLSAKVEKSSDTCQSRGKAQASGVAGPGDKLNQQLDKAKNATESTWDDVKSGSKKAYNELAAGFEQARQWVSDKIAP
jgi:hypothetical protein